MKINWNRSDYMLLGKNSRKENIVGIGNKVKETKYLGIMLTKGIMKSAKSRLNKMVRERLKYYQRKIYNKLDKSTRIGLQWFEALNL